MSKITYHRAIALSNILGKSTIKNLGGELFLPTIKVKSALTSTIKKFQELQQDIYKESGIQFNIDGTVPANTPHAVLKQVSEAIRNLENEEVEIENLEIFAEADLQRFYEENPSMVTSDVEVVYECMVKK